MLVTLLGIVTDVNPPQSQKAASPMSVTLFGIVTEVKPQLLKAEFPIFVTLFGIVTKVKSKQPLKALYPIDVAFVPILTDINVLFISYDDSDIVWSDDVLVVLSE